jgi:hypothetical protein
VKQCNGRHSVQAGDKINRETRPEMGCSTWPDTTTDVVVGTRCKRETRSIEEVERKWAARRGPTRRLTWWSALGASAGGRVAARQATAPARKEKRLSAAAILTQVSWIRRSRRRMSAFATSDHSLSQPQSARFAARCSPERSRSRCRSDVMGSRCGPGRRLDGPQRFFATGGPPLLAGDLC